MKLDTKGPLLAELRVKDNLIEHLKERYVVFGKQTQVLKAMLRVPRMYYQFR